MRGLDAELHSFNCELRRAVVLKLIVHQADEQDVWQAYYYCLCP